MNQDSPTEVIGSGFVPGIPGIYGNMVVPEPGADEAEASTPPSDVPAELPQIEFIDNTLPASRPSPKTKAAKADKD